MAIQSIYRDLEYAKSLIKRKVGKNEQENAVEDDDTEESWTFVGSDEPDPDHVTTKLSEGLAGPGGSLGEKAAASEVLKDQVRIQARTELMEE